jgi:hypothetical protein
MSDGRRRALFWLGLVLPDLLAWGWRGLLGAPEALTAPLRSPIGLLPWCGALALLFEREWRGRAFVLLALGAWLRLPFGEPIYWAFPFTLARIDAPFPVWALAFAPLAEFGLRRLSRSRAASARAT